jgi:phage shock protein PspC (stress-responsive transcriptional regulator)
MPEPSRPTPVTRLREGRWCSGVCRGLATARDLDVVWLRLGIVALALLGGVGIALYVAAWLIMPAEAEAATPYARGGRGAVGLAQALGACVGLLALAAAGALATVFGFGWVVFAVAAALLVGLLAVRRLGPGWPLLPVAALALPSVAVAAGGLSLTPRTHAAVVRVGSIAQLTGHTYRAGLNTMLIDLRHTPALQTMSRSRDVTLHVHAGIRRTIVALPDDACVHVRVNFQVNPFPLRMASLLSGRSDHAFGDLFLFGRLYGGRTSQTMDFSGLGSGPTLTVDFASQGGSLYVRDYPDSVDPDQVPDWPGYPVGSEPRPNTTGTTRAGAHAEVLAWRARRQADLAEAARVNALRPGPCGTR